MLSLPKTGHFGDRLAHLRNAREMEIGAAAKAGGTEPRTWRKHESGVRGSPRISGLGPFVKALRLDERETYWLVMGEVWR